MGRGKLKLELIANEKSRKTTFQKRKKGLMKKAYEFSVLCDIDICLLISGPTKDRVLAQTRSDEDANDIETYPPENDNVLRIIQKYQKVVMQRPPNKNYNLPSLLAERNKQVHADISRCKKKYYGCKYPASAELVDGFSTDELAELVGRLDGKIKMVKKVIADKKENQLKMIKSKNVFNNNHHQELIAFTLNNFSTNSIVDMNKMPPPLQISSGFSMMNPNSMMNKLLSGDDNHSTSTSSFDVHDDQHHHQLKYYFNGTSSNGMNTFRGPIYDDPTAGGILLENMVMHNGTGNGTNNNNNIMMSMSNNNMLHYSTVTTPLRGPIYNDPMAGMSLEKYMMMFNGSSTAAAVGSSMQTQDHQHYYPHLVQPYMQMQYPMNAMNVGPRLGSFQVTLSASRGNKLTDVVDDFLKN